ncbi:Cyclin-D3-1-like protein [Drosera capensis]
MAVSQHQEHQPSSSASFLLDALFCEEEQWDDDEEEEEEQKIEAARPGGSGEQPLLPMMFLEQDLFWADEELILMFQKEAKKQRIIPWWLNTDEQDGATITDLVNLDDDEQCDVGLARKEAVEWMLRVNGHHRFSTLTAILAINYLDRFLSSIRFQKDNKSWMIQLAAVTCVSLAAKVEEAHVPILLHLQVPGTKYMFDAKTIQKMELLVLSSLEWKMHPVTPLSYLEHIIRRFGFKSHIQAEFLRRCERLLLCLVSDSRFVGYPPSVLATATMLHIIDEVELTRPLDYQNQLLGLLSMIKGNVIECYQFIVATTGSGNVDPRELRGLKRKNHNVPSSPSRVIDGYFSYESSNDSLAVIGSSVSSSPVVMKKSRVEELQMPALEVGGAQVD